MLDTMLVGVQTSTRSQVVASIADRTASQQTSNERLLLNSISSCFRDIGLQTLLGHEFDLSGSRDHLTPRFPIGCPLEPSLYL